MSDRQERSGWWLASDGKWYAPESHPSAVTATAPPTSGSYAGFWLRVWAVLIDAIIVAIGAGILVSVLNVEGGGSSEDLTAVELLTNVGAAWLYFALMESSALRATVGKMALGINVTDLTGERISFGRATGRHFGKFVSILILGIGYLMAGWTPKKQALHDRMADTLVVRK